MKKIHSKFAILALACLIFPQFGQAQSYADSNRIALPSELYMLSETPNEIFIQPFLRRWKPYDNFVRFSSKAPFSRRLEKVATITNPINDVLKVDLYEGNNFKIIQTINCNIKTAIKGVGDKEVVVQVIGDSYTQGSFFKSALLDNNNVPKIKMVGIRSIGGTQNQFTEGRGGWRLSTYFSMTANNPKKISPYNGFYQPEGEYRFWGSTNFWRLAILFTKNETMNVETGKKWEFIEQYGVSHFDSASKRFDEKTGYVLKPQKGDVQFDDALNSFVVYDGKKWAQKTEQDFKWSFQYDKYLKMWNISSPQILFVMLGLNDFRSSPTNDYKAWNDQYLQMKKSYTDAVPNGKFVICIPATSCGTLDNQAGDFTVLQNAIMWEVRKNIITTFDNRQSEGIYVLDAGITIDNEKGYNFKDGIQTGNPHPYLSYPALGVPFAAFIQYHRK